MPQELSHAKYLAKDLLGGVIGSGDTPPEFRDLPTVAPPGGSGGKRKAKKAAADDDQEGGETDQQGKAKQWQSQTLR